MLELDTKQYVMHQCATLREEVARRQAARNRLEEIAILGIVAAYAWIATNGSNIEDVFAGILVWWLPPFIALVAYSRQLSITRGIDRVAEFTQRIETVCELPRQLSWEAFVLEERAGWRFAGNRRAASFLWAQIIGASFLIACFSTVRILEPLG